MSKRKPGKKARKGEKASRYDSKRMTPSNGQRLPAENEQGTRKLIEKDQSLLKEIKRIKKLQRGLYKEYEISELDIEEDD